MTPELTDVTELPQAALDELFAAGEIAVVTTFDEFMRPDIHWIAPAEYREAFEQLTGDETVDDCAAYTKPEGSYPGYINIQRDHTGAFIFTVRADPVRQPGLPLVCGEAAVVTIPEDEFHQLFATANRLPVPRGADEKSETE